MRVPPVLRRHRTGLSVLATAAVLAALPVVFRNPFHLGILNLIGIQAIAALGLNLFIGYTGQISLGHAAFVGLGAYGSAVLTAGHGFPPWATLAAVAAGTGAVALLVGLPALRLSGHYLAMATLGFNVVVHAVMVEWDAVTGGPSGIAGIPSLAVAGVPVSGEVRFHWLVWGVVMICLLLGLNLVRSGVGRGLAALSQDETAAACMGVDVRRGKVSVFVLSAVLASISGSLYAHYSGYVNPDSFGVFASIDLVIMVVIGGMGSLWGTLLGAGVVTLLPHLLGRFEVWKEVVHGLVLVVILLFLPRGLVTGLADAVRMRATRGVRARRPAEPKRAEGMDAS